MDRLEHLAVDLLTKILEIYWGNGPAEPVFQFLAQNIIWCGGEEPCIYRGLEQVQKLLLAPKNRKIVRLFDLGPVPLSDTACLISGQAELSCPTSGSMPEVYQVTAMFQSVHGSAELCQLHLSSAPSCGESSWDTLQKIAEKKAEGIEEQKWDLDLLTENIPGGMLRCLFDEPLTILQVSDGFVSMFGYSRKEIQERFHNSFWEMIEPQDRKPSRADAVRQLAISNRKELEYRITCRDGKTIWVLDKGQLIRDRNGRESFCCILVDITNAKLAQEELRVSLERHKIIMDQSNDIIFEWTIQTNRILFSSNWEKKFGYPPEADFSEFMLQNQAQIHPDDVNVLAEIRSLVLQGEPYLEREFRFANQSGNYIWCKIRSTTLYDNLRRPIRAVGVLMDIDHEKKQSQRLVEKAERDALTGLYNKITVQTLIDDLLELECTDALSALMIVDIDNFKLVNDNLGHLCGDAVLTDVAREIRNQFRGADIIGRIGGDEFMVFMKDIRTKLLAEQKAQQIISAIQSIPVGGSNKQWISCSIGIAFYPEQGQRLEELYKKADSALYCAKRQGKNQYTIYGDSLTADSQDPVQQHPRSAINEKIDSNENLKELNSKLVEYVFRILYKSMNVEKAVNSILEIIGKQFDVSRVYIFEDSLDGKTCSNTFEWCNAGIIPEMANLQNLSYDDELLDYQKNFDPNGIFYCRDTAILPPQHQRLLYSKGIKSVLQYRIVDNGLNCGFVGFDECHGHRYWTQEQIDSLALTAEILSTFLLKKRAKDRVAQYANGLCTVLDNQNSWIFVIEPETYKILYINQKTLQLAPHARLGLECHKAFFDLPSPCEGCPISQLCDERKNHIREVYNPHLNVWSVADASLISWKGEKAVLLSCHDISKYKR